MKKYISVCLLALVAACSSPNPDFFQPVPMMVSTERYPNVTSMILLNQVLMAPETTRPQITTLGKKDFQVKIDEFNRWGAAPERLVQRVINQNLSQLMPNAMVENQSTLRKNYKYAVVVEIQEMSGRLNENTYLKASYFIRNKKGKIIKSGRFNKEMVIKGGYEEYVPAHSKLLAELSAQIAKDLAKLK